MGAVTERSFIAIDRGPIECEFSRGSRDLPALVFLHEGLGSIDLWRGVPNEIAAAVGGAPVLVYARHGHGASAPAETPRPVDYMHHEALVVLPALLDAFDIRHPVLIGHSDGASIALIAAGDGLPVAGIVCLAPHVFVEDETIAGIGAARDSFASTDLVDRLGRYHDDPVATFRGWNDVWLSDGFRSWNIERSLPAIHAPTLVVQGTDDDYGTFGQLDAIERGVGGPVRRLEVDGAGHAPHLDARTAVVTEIVEFVRRLGEPADRGT